MLTALCVITAIFAVLRFIVPVDGKINKRDIYKDLAHIWVGILFGIAAAENSPDFWFPPIGLTAVEVVAFIVRRK